MKQPAFYTASLAIGDCICATPTIRKISEIYNQKVRVFSHHPSLFQNLPYVSSSDDVKDYITLDQSEKLREDYDLHYSFWKLGQKLSLSDTRGVEFKHAIMDIRQYHAIDNGFMLKKEELHCDFIPSPVNLNLPEKYVCLHPFKNWPSRTWDNSNWKYLISLLKRHSIPIVIIGKSNVEDSLMEYLKSGVKGKTDERVFEELSGKETMIFEEEDIFDFTNKTNLSEAWEILNRATCVVTMDSGILHLAGTTDTFIIQLGSSIDPEFRAPYRKGTQDYKYAYIDGKCKIMCASNMIYSLRDWANGYNGGTPLQSVPLIDTCLEHKPTMECHPTHKQVFEKIKEVYVKTNDTSVVSISKKDYENRHLIKINSHALGDTIGAVSVISSYAKENNLQVGIIANLEARYFKNSYPEIIFFHHKTVPSFSVNSGTWSIENDHFSEYKEIFYVFDKPLLQGYADQLNIKKIERPRIDLFENSRPIKNRYICFSMHSTAQAKHWNYPAGWYTLCKLLRKEGITPVCIDQHSQFGIKNNWNKVPANCVSKHGLNLAEMTNYIHHAEFFIGISSGLSWVAHALNKKVILISGVTSKDNEFSEDTVRIIDSSVCHGCINNKSVQFDPGDWMWCPFHKGTPRQFECTRVITPETVFEQAKRILYETD